MRKVFRPPEATLVAPAGLMVPLAPAVALMVSAAGRKTALRVWSARTPWKV